MGKQRRGRGGREIDRWQGPMNWPPDWEELPALFTGRRVDDKWIWSDGRGDRVCLYSATPKGCGMEIKPWAYQRGATEFVVMIVANPGAEAADASAQALGTQGHGTGENKTGEDARDRALAEMYGDMFSPAARAANASDASDSGDGSRSVDEAFRDMFSQMLGHESHPGRGFCRTLGQALARPRTRRVNECSGSFSEAWDTAARAFAHLLSMTVSYLHITKLRSWFLYDNNASLFDRLVHGRNSFVYIQCL